MGTNSTLRKLAATLGEFPDPKKANMACTREFNSGTLLNAGITKVGKSEEKVNPKKQYMLPKDFVPIDHFKALKHEFKTGGEKAVRQYVKTVRTYMKLQVENAKPKSK